MNHDKSVGEMYLNGKDRSQTHKSEGVRASDCVKCVRENNDRERDPEFCRSVFFS